MDSRNKIIKKKIIITISLFLISFIVFAPIVLACGCGLALSEQKVFNALKETQAYLLIDIKDNNSYDEMPFFRMVSMEEPYEVTLVFPIADIPYDVEGKKMTAEKFLNDYKILEAENYITKQSIKGIIDKTKKDFKDASFISFSLSNGLFGLIKNFMLGSFGTRNMADFSPIAHFDFEGGKLDIYDVKSAKTLDEFVKSINIELTGEVKELVNKYKNYYTAVLYLNVPSVLDSDLRDQLKQRCPEQTERVKKELETKTDFTYREIEDLSQGNCQSTLRELITSVTTGVNSKLEGTLVDMKFKNSDKFFYPTSIVNSYKYPITDQKYFIKTPSGLSIDLETSKVGNLAYFNKERWYKIDSTEEDISGKIINVDFLDKIKDNLKLLNQKIYGITGWIVLAIYLLIIIIPFLFYRYKTKTEDRLTRRQFLSSLVAFMIGGLLLSSIFVFFNKKRKLALILFVIWLVILLIKILS